ncbi:hypothetical protein CPHO_06225 [Corynebacterium phocae]|uniref:VWFA domain-containing protein n=1 Tax=Corynebacterium phocae TaxID=161895 RepID=A0A1L7D352_9CORY|nr:hypothetical protein [Corynebacterium phocae]APT92554.1 hypothetical protein CPHO_06225 [Corynebacterium phocae]KAA8725156.1 hypothetical protein F4V58_05770 [Corynebacterium phocae]
MARHLAPRSNFAIARWLLALLAISALLLLAGAVALLSSKPSFRADQVPVTTAPETTAPETAGPETAGPDTTAPPTNSSENTVISSPASLNPSVEESSPPPPPLPRTTPADTLILLDTSHRMAPFYPAASAELAATAQALGAAGKQVALWNYSSPLNPGITVGYRDNLGFGPAQDVATAVVQFGTGGVPQTRSAVLAAINYAAAVPGSRIVLVTAGTEADIDEAAFIPALEQALGTGVELAVIHLGQMPVDEVLREHAKTFAHPAIEALPETLSQATGV